MEKLISKDGTTIAYDKAGKGAAVILVGGALATRADHDKLAKLLASNFRVFNYDRRGRGDSGDTQPYGVGKEIEDIESIINAAGGSVFLYGISSGACLALEAAAALGQRVRKLAIYEAPYDDAEGVAEQWKDYSRKLNDLIAKGRNGDAVELHMQTVGAPDEVIAEMKSSPAWQKLEKLAPTIAYDVAVVGKTRSVPAARIAAIKVPTLVVDGGESLKPMPFMHATADKIGKTISSAERKTLHGQNHNVDEKVLAPVLIEFFSKEN